MGTSLGSLFLAEGWGTPVSNDEPQPIVAFSDEDPFVTRVADHHTPPNLVRDTYPPYVEEISIAADFERRRRPRRSPPKRPRSSP
jgi:hypothetical protein